jgi:hypothetical protein
MSTLKSTQLTNNAASPPVRGAFNRNGSALRYKLGTWTVTAAEVTSEQALTSGNMVVQMVKVPKGAIVNRALSYIEWEAMGTTCTVDVGDGGSQSRYCSALAMGSASTGGVTTFEELGGAGVYVAEYEYTEEDTIDLKNTATINTLVAGKTVKMHVFYTQNG